MATVFDYLRWRGDLSFDVSPLCEIDALIFCEISYIFFDGIVPQSADGNRITVRDAAEKFFERNADKEIISLGEIVPREIVDLFRLAATTKRFSEIEIGHFVNIINDETVEQFSAMTFFPDDDYAFIAYRGTDDSIAGWRENFRMSYLTPVPAQLRAEEYLMNTATNFNGRIILGGHSKGGNLALWSGLNAPDEICNRIEKVYNFDGPGFLDDVWISEKYRRIADRVYTIIPTGSVVGLLLKYDDNYHVTRSETKKHLLQHNALTWNVLGCEFVRDTDISPDIKRSNELLRKWIYSMEPSQRKAFVEGLFSIFYSTHAKTLTDLAANKKELIKAFTNIDHDTRQALTTGIKYFLGESYASFAEQFKAMFKKKEEDNNTEAENVVVTTVNTKPVARKKIKIEKAQKTNLCNAKRKKRFRCFVRKKLKLCKCPGHNESTP